MFINLHESHSVYYYYSEIEDFISYPYETSFTYKINETMKLMKMYVSLYFIYHKH